jgi:AraC-like DNA-binding protein
MVGVSSTSAVIHDLESAERELGAHFPDVRLGRVDRDGFRSTFATTAGDRFTVMAYTFEGSGAATSGSEDLVVVMSRGRGYQLAHGREAVDTSRPFLVPAEGLAGRWDAFDAKLVRLDLGAVERIARAAAGDPSFRLVRRGTAPVSPERARHWSLALGAFERMLAEAPEAFESPIFAEGMFHQLATAFLHAFATSWVEVAERDDAHVAPSAVVRRAVEYMHEHAGEPITVQHVADAAFISTRGLHYAFTRDLDRSPSEVLRRIRLERARADLAASDGRLTVAAVARRWGFANSSRFSQAYHRAFGEHPAETLRR